MHRMLHALTPALSRSGARALAVTACLTAASLVGRAPAQDLVPSAGPQQSPIVLVNAVLHPVDGPSIDDGVMHVVDGRITWVGAADDAPAAPPNAETIDLAGDHVYPGFVSTNTIMGLMEVASLRDTMDDNEIGSVTPEARAISSVNPDSTLIPVTRSNGVLSALTLPTGGLVPGRAAVIRLDGWTWEDMALRADAGLVLNWPRVRPITAWWMRRSAEEQLAQSAEELRSIRELFDAAEAYAAARDADPTLPQDHRYDAMLPAMRGDVPVFIRANEQEQIRSAVAFAVERKLDAVILGGADADRCADLLVRHDIGVIVNGTHRLPQNRHDAPSRPFSLPARLEAAGVRWCLGSPGGSDETPHERNLPYQAGTAVAYGLDRAEALRSITIDAAAMLGLGDELGALRPGLRATFFTCTGDPLEIETQVRAAWIDGRRVDLDDKHKALDRKYREKYRQLDRAGG